MGCVSPGCGEVVAAFREILGVLEELERSGGEQLKRLLAMVRVRHPGCYMVAAAILAAASALLSNMLEKRGKEV